MKIKNHNPLKNSVRGFCMSVVARAHAARFGTRSAHALLLFLGVVGLAVAAAPLRAYAATGLSNTYLDDSWEAPYGWYSFFLWTIETPSSPELTSGQVCLYTGTYPDTSNQYYCQGGTNGAYFSQYATNIYQTTEGGAYHWANEGGNSAGFTDENFFITLSPSGDTDPDDIVYYSQMNVYGTVEPSYENDDGVSTAVLALTAPETGTTVSSTNGFTISFDFRIGSTTWQNSTSTTTPTGYELKIYDPSSGKTEIYRDSFYASLTNGIHSQDVTIASTTLSGGVYDSVRLTNGATNTANLKYVSQYSSVGSSFNIDTEDAWSVETSGLSDTTYLSSSCVLSWDDLVGSGTFDFGNCVGYLFYPSTSVLSGFSDINLENSFPFSYAYELPKIRDALFASDSTASTTVAVTIPWLNNGETTLTFLSAAMIENVPYTSTIKTILAALLWLMFAELMYYQIIRVHDHSTRV